MPLTVICLLGVTAFVCAILGAMGRCPWWVSVVVLSVLELLRCLPLGR